MSDCCVVPKADTSYLGGSWVELGVEGGGRKGTGWSLELENVELWWTVG